MYNLITEQLIDASKDWATKNISRLPGTDGDYVDVSLGDLKTNGVLRINVVNPITNKVFSNESFVRMTKKENNFTYSVTTYDLIDANEVEEGAPTITLNGEQVINAPLGVVYREPGIVEDKDVSMQILYQGKEVSKIDIWTEGTYTIYYSLLENNKLGINIRTVIVK
jgi:hypothetical protein